MVDVFKIMNVILRWFQIYKVRMLHSELFQMKRANPNNPEFRTILPRIILMIS